MAVGFPCTRAYARTYSESKHVHSIQHTYRAYVVYTYGAYTLYIQCTQYICTENVQYTHGVYTMYTQTINGIQRVYTCTHTEYAQCTHRAHTQCTHRGHTVHTQNTQVQHTCTLSVYCLSSVSLPGRTKAVLHCQLPVGFLLPETKPSLHPGWIPEKEHRINCCSETRMPSR